MADQLAVFDESTAKDVLATMAALKGSGLLGSIGNEGLKEGYLGQQVWNTPIPTLVYNDSGFIIPAYGLMEVTDTVNEQPRCYVKVRRPTVSVPPGPTLINGSTDIPIEGYGFAQAGPLYRVLHDGGTYVAGSKIGIKKDNFTAAQGWLFSVIGNDDVATNVVLVALAEPTRLLLAYTTAGATARSGTTLGKGTATMRYLAVSGSDRVATATTDTTEIEYFNLSASVVGTNKYLMLLRYENVWLANWEDC